MRNLRILRRPAVLLGIALMLVATAAPATARFHPASAAAPAPGKAPVPAAACAGAVVRGVDVSAPGPLPRLCIAVGGVVRLVNLAPDALSARPAALVDCRYAAGTFQCRLLRPGTVRLTVAPGARHLTVRVPRSVPGRAATACASPGTVVDLDTNEEIRWWAPCLRIGATLRVVDLGPGLLTVTPAAAVRCRYEAGIHACRFRAPATVTVTAALDGGSRSATVVAVR